MTAVEVLELSLVRTAIEEEPPRPGVTYRASERGIKTKARLVNEVIHVRFHAAVVVAEKDHPLFAIEKHPTSKVNSANAPQMARSCNVPRRVINNAECADHRQQTDQARLTAAERGVLICNEVVLRRG